MATIKTDIAAMQGTLARIDTATTDIAARLTSQAAQLAALRASLPDPADQAALDAITAQLATDAATLEAMGKPDTPAE
jgi:hypothetical protein